MVWGSVVKRILQVLPHAWMHGLGQCGKKDFTSTAPCMDAWFGAVW